MSMSDSDSPLSSPPESEDELPSLPIPNGIIDRSPSPPPKKQRKPRTPHVPTFADLPEIAFIVAFLSRFNSAFKGVPNLGPQDIESGVINLAPSEQVEQVLCRLVTLVLNRKKNVEKGHHSKALEEAIHANQSQWATEWGEKSPLAGGKKFNDLDAKQRLVLLRCLILWALNSSETIRAILSESYKTSRRNDDLNVPLSIQPWGRDGERRRYFLIEGRDDTPFRVYRESDPHQGNVAWESVAGNIDDLKVVATELAEDGTKNARELQGKILAALPRFEEGENKRRRREYRQTRKSYFQQVSAAYSYEGRTRGKRIKYSFSDDDEGARNVAESLELDESKAKRSGRSRMPTPSTLEVPRFTASGRQIKKPSLPYSSHATTPGHATPISAGSENGDLNAFTDMRATRQSYRIARHSMLLDDSEDGGDSYNAEDDEDDYKQGASDGTDGDDDDGMSVVSSEREFLTRGGVPVRLKYSKNGPVDRYLMKFGGVVTETADFPIKEDVVMEDVSREERLNGTDVTHVERPSTIKVNGQDPEIPNHLHQIPVGSILPQSAVAEIRSKSSEVG